MIAQIMAIQFLKLNNFFVHPNKQRISKKREVHWNISIYVCFSCGKIFIAANCKNCKNCKNCRMGNDINFQ